MDPSGDLSDLARRAAARAPGASAVRAAGETLRYGELDARANQMAQALRFRGVTPGSRVALWLEKSPTAVVATQAVLRAGAAYVPIDPLAPLARAAAVLQDCSPAAVVTTNDRLGALAAHGLGHLPALTPGPQLERFSTRPLPEPPAGGEALAYILYTSGSTGAPKGVCISHRAALAFALWGRGELAVTASDVLANHAPLHFDLSVFDLYAAFAAGACVTLVPDALAYSPPGLARWIETERPTLWYSVPFALISLIDHARVLDAPPPMRAVLFAGEVFPIAPLRRLRRAWPGVRLLNLYGPTETNVCTFHEVRGDLEGRATPVPIGRACCGDRVWAVKDDGTPAGPGEEGALFVSGPTLMSGYWGRPPQGDAPYATGDQVRVLTDGELEYLGRRDEMIKLRGYRIEPGDVEAALRQHPAVRDAAVVVDTSRTHPRLVAFLACDRPAPSLLEVKQHCAQRLPRYMLVDAVRALPVLPRSRNGKLDRQSLRQLLSSESRFQSQGGLHGDTNPNRSV